ncbi:patatin-like phospholipase family protein, partial [Amycolatopsis rhizosphaerae]
MAQDIPAADGVLGPADPVRFIPGDEAKAPRQGTGLCLSGGGFRAMLFHAGVLWRLNEAGRLPGLDRISSVSGGSLTAGVLARYWNALDFGGTGVAGNFEALVVKPLRATAHREIDIPAVLTGAALPATSIADRVTKAYREHLFGDVTLHDLPVRPRFVFNATNLASGVLMRFSRPFLADYRVGRVPEPALPLAVAVAASSAFPPFLSPCTVDLSGETWVTDPGNDLTGPEYRGRVRLTDGGVYDNLGLETVWKLYRTVLVSDGGGRLTAEADPHLDWPRQLLRVLDVVDNQVRALRKRQVIAALKSHE